MAVGTKDSPRRLALTSHLHAHLYRYSADKTTYVVAYPTSPSCLCGDVRLGLMETDYL